MAHIFSLQYTPFSFHVLHRRKWMGRPYWHRLQRGAVQKRRSSCRSELFSRVLPIHKLLFYNKFACSKAIMKETYIVKELDSYESHSRVHWNCHGMWNRTGLDSPYSADMFCRRLACRFVLVITKPCAKAFLFLSRHVKMNPLVGSVEIVDESN